MEMINANIVVALIMATAIGFVAGLVITFLVMKKRSREQDKRMVRILTENCAHATSRLASENRALKEENQKLKSQIEESAYDKRL